MDGATLSVLMADTPTRIAGWRAQAQQLTQLLVPARIEGHVSDDLHVTIERTCTAIYSEIEAVSAITKDVAKTSAEAAAQLAPIEDVLRLVLLEITELSTELYAIRSGLSQTGELALGSP
ncbi:MAG: hypothetical protein ABI398_02175 [Devosia sp.]